MYLYVNFPFFMGHPVCIKKKLLGILIFQCIYRFVGNGWIGLNKLHTDGDHEWSDGSALDFVNWNDGEPNEAWGSESCASMYANNG